MGEPVRGYPLLDGIGIFLQEFNIIASVNVHMQTKVVYQLLLETHPLRFYHAHSYNNNNQEAS